MQFKLLAMDKQVQNMENININQTDWRDHKQPLVGVFLVTGDENNEGIKSEIDISDTSVGNTNIHPCNNGLDKEIKKELDLNEFDIDPLADDNTESISTTENDLLEYKKIHEPKIKEDPLKNTATCDETEDIEAMEIKAENLPVNSRIDTRYKFRRDGKNKIFECANCSKVFHRKDGFERHYYKHSGEFPYACTSCSYKTREKACMRRHMEVRHKIIVTNRELHKNNTTKQKPIQLDVNMPKRQLYKILECATKKLYKCKICEKVMKGNLEAHFRVHSGERPFVCAICDMKYTQKRLLRKHMRIKHQIEQPKVIKNKPIIESSQLVNGGVLCKHCNKVFVRKNYRRHIDMLAKKIYACPVCTIKNKTEESHTLHMVAHHTKVYSQNGIKHIVNGKPQYVCKFCKRSFSCKGPFKQHIGIHLGFRLYKCSYCTYKNNFKHNVQKHVRKKHGLEIKCNQIQEDTIEVHVSQNEETDAADDSNEAEVTQPTEAEIKMEEEVDSSEEGVVKSAPYKPKSTQKPPYYRIIKDGEITAYECTVCGRITKERYLVERHILTHTGEFPLSCSLCDAKVRQKKSMKVHLKRFHNLDVTLKDISKDGSLKATSRVKAEDYYRIVDEEGIKVYQCTICNKLCKHKYTFDKHFAQHRGSYPYICSLCQYKTTEEAHWQRHMLDIHHRDAENTYVTQKELLQMSTNITEVDIKMESTSSNDIEENTIEIDDGKSEEQNFVPDVVVEKEKVKFKCTICDKDLLERFLLTAHLRTHADENRWYSCTVCDHKDKSRKNIKSHMRRRHKMFVIAADVPETSTPKDPENYNISNSASHGKKSVVIKKDNVKYYQCSICYKSTKKKSQFEAHLMMHKGVCLYWCKLCDYGAREKKYVKRHMKLRHNVDIDVKDLVRDAKAVDRMKDAAEEEMLDVNTDSQDNEAVETPEKKTYSCNICDKTFHTMSGFNKHNRTHSDYRPFSCSHCEYRCKDKYGLIAHTFTKHNIIVTYEDIVMNDKNIIKSKPESIPSVESTSHLYKCDDCQFSCVVEATLTRHKKYLHGRKQETPKDDDFE